MADTTQDRDGTGIKQAQEQNGEVYDRRTLTYANSFDDRWTSLAIRTIEWATGKLSILRMVNKFEKNNAKFWGQESGAAPWIPWESS